MRHEPVTTATIEYCALEELSPSEQELVKKAREATRYSHSPYSQYRVGCAVRLKDGAVVCGANQENASYGLTCCAERTTIFAVNNQGKKHEVAALAVTARPANADDSYVGTAPVTPCGACRQVIKEAEDLAGMSIILLMDCYDNQRIARMVGISGLLPLAFGPADLGMAM